MSPATLLVRLAVPALVIGFWAWMFNDMLHNDDIPSMERSGLRWPPEAKNQWVVLFIILNIVTAGYYYLTVYREK